MIPVKQEFKHNPPESTGDCFRACLATVLEMPLADVPHFAELFPAPKDFWLQVDGWLRTRGYERFPWASPRIPPASVLSPLIVTGDGGRGINHACVYYRGELFNDPSTHDNANGLVAPCEDGLYWVNAICKL